MTRLVGRRQITDRSEQYESAALIVVECAADGPRIYAGYPPKDSPVHFSRFFERLYRVYDERYSYIGADKNHCRKYWVLASDSETRALKLQDPQDVGQFTYQPRLWQD